MDALPIAPGAWSLTLPADLFANLYAHLYPGDGDEHGAVLSAGLARLPHGGVRLLARELFLARDGVDYVPGKRGYRMLKAEFIRDRILRCRDEKLVYLAVHNHGGSDRVAFSRDDLDSHERGYPALLDIARGQPVGALVFAPGAVAGDIWLPGGSRVELTQATIIGARRQVLTQAPLQRERVNLMTYDRQARMFGEDGQALLRAAKVAIIGLGGVGSLLAEYLGRLGVGRFILIDPERLHPSNLSRVVGAYGFEALPWLHSAWAPFWLRSRAEQWSAPKVRIARRVIRQANSHAEIDAIRADFLAPAVAAKVLDCDYIFLAADTMRARLLFNAIVHQYLIPGVQIGSKVSVNKETGAVTDVFSVVRPVKPGHGCLWCNQLINPTKLADEAKTAGERRGQRYVDEPEVANPSVITLNGVGAAHAANDFLFYMTGLARADASQDYFRHQPSTRRSFADEPRRDFACIECGTAPGARFGHGDSGRRLPTNA